MDVDESAGGLATELAAEPSNRRATPRLPVDGAASLLVLKHDCCVPCRVVDLSMGGCRIETRERFLVGIFAQVEVSFTVRGLIFRFNGITQWTDSQRQVGIRFADMTSRRRDELADLLCELKEENAAKAARQAAEKAAAEQRVVEEGAGAGAQVQLKGTSENSQVHGLPIAPETAASAGSDPGAATRVESGRAEERPGGSPLVSEIPEAEYLPAGPRFATPAKRERRAQPRHEVDTSAVIYLIHVGSALHGRIHDLSVGGCRIRTDERFPVGIYTRVETEFRLEGLPFRLGGVIQAIHDRQQVGIRFLDVSDRKRGQVEQLIEEIEQMDESQKSAEPQG
jgi:hypothetical protein